VQKTTVQQQTKPNLSPSLSNIVQLCEHDMLIKEFKEYSLKVNKFSCIVS